MMNTYHDSYTATVRCMAMHKFYNLPRDDLVQISVRDISNEDNRVIIKLN